LLAIKIWARDSEPTTQNICGNSKPQQPALELEILAHTADSHCLAVTLRRSSEGGTHPLVRVLAGNAHLGRQSEAPTCSTSMPSTATIASAFSTASGVSIIAINSVCSLRTLQTTAYGMAA
jgi:hypothetical protein